MRQTLFEIGADAQALADLLIEVGGELSSEEEEEAVDRWFAEIGDRLELKVDSYCALIAEMQARADARYEEGMRLTNQARVDQNAAERLKGRLKLFFEMTNRTKLQTPRFTISLAKNGGKAPLIIEDEAAVSEDFLKVAVAPDREAIRKALEMGRTLEFARLGNRGTSLRIK